MTEIVTEEKKSSSELDVNDKLTLKTLEAEALSAKVSAMEAQQRAGASIQQLNRFAESLFEKYGVNKEEYLLDTNAFKFAPRPAAPKA